jgi:hypothetical protein
MPSGDLILEVQLPHGQGAEDVAAFAAEVPAEPALYFLRNKGVEAQTAGLPRDVATSELPFFRLVRPDSMVLSVDGKVVPLPGTETSYLISESAGEFAGLIERIDAIR